MKRVIYHCEADVELVAAAKYYQCQREALGREFLHTVHLEPGKVQQNPKRFSFCDRPIRSCRIPGFPYRIIYEEFDEAIYIFAVMHLSRDPKYWKRRRD